MGILSRLKALFQSESSLLSKDLLWQSELAKYQALLGLVPSSQQLFFVSFFPTEHQQLMQVFKQAGIQYTERQSAEELSSALVQVSLAMHLPATPPSHARYYFNGKHPLFQEEQKVLQKLPAQSHSFYLSLEAPLLERFGGQERLGMLYQRLQIPTSEAFEHKMISRSLQAAQKKIEKMLTWQQISPAGSEAEWFAKNLSDKSV